jgi:hypothetical protein
VGNVFRGSREETKCGHGFDFALEHAVVAFTADWWQPYSPPLVGLLGSIIVAGAAFLGVVESNRTNQRAIDAADERERDRWDSDNERERDNTAFTKAQDKLRVTTNDGRIDVAFALVLCIPGGAAVLTDNGT